MIRIIGHLPLAEASRAAELETLFAEFISMVADDSGVLEFAYYRDTEAPMYYVHETYVDSDAGLAHLERVGEAMLRRLGALTMPSHVEIYGEPTPECLAAFESFHPVVARPLRPTPTETGAVSAR
jgi:quinol monooxygenase YgiN